MTRYIHRWKICSDGDMRHLGRYEAETLKWVQWVPQCKFPEAAREADEAAKKGEFAP